MKKTLVLVAILGIFLIGCTSMDQANSLERQQQGANQVSLIQNQPVPNLGGWSFEREVVIQTYMARNRTIATWTYTMTEYDGKIIEICPSIGYPIPYSTELTNPLYAYGSTGAVIANAEPNGLYPPSSAEATLVQCSNPDGSVSPTYWEQRVFALPYRVKSAVQLQKADDAATSFSIKTTK